MPGSRAVGEIMQQHAKGGGGKRRSVCCHTNQRIAILKKETKCISAEPIGTFTNFGAKAFGEGLAAAACHVREE